MARIFLVNDRPVLIDLFGAVLREAGNEPICGGASDRAIDRFDHAKPELVVVDLLDPPVGGLEVVRWVKTVRPGCPVLVVSGFDDVEHVMEAVLMGADRYLPLPCDWAKLRLTIGSALSAPARYPEEAFGRWVFEHAAGDRQRLAWYYHQVQSRNCRSWSSLHTAAVWNHPERADRLLAAGMNVNARGHLGGTPLHWAARNGHFDVALVLLAHGADRTALDAFGRTPACLSAEPALRDMLRVGG